VVGGEHLDSVVLEARDDRLDVAPGAQGGVHLVVRVEGAEPLVGQGEMVRARLGRHAHPAPLAFADQLDRAGRRDVLDMEPAAGDLGQADVARDHDVLGRRGHAAEAEPHRLEPLVDHAADGQLGNLAVLHDDAVEHFRVFQRPAHQGGRPDRRAVVSKRDRAAGHQLP
jgi:hypothetical protein